MDMRLLVIEGAFHLRGRDLLLWPPRAIRRAPAPRRSRFAAPSLSGSPAAPP